MKKFIGVLMLCVSLLFGFTGFTGCGGGLSGMTSLDTTNDDYKFDSIQQQLSALKSAINGNTSVIVSIQDNVAALQAQVAANASADAANASADAAAIEALQARVVLLEADAAHYAATLASLQSIVDQHSVDIATIQAQASALSSDVRGLSQDVCVLFSQLNALSAKLDALAGAVATFGLTVPHGDLGTGFYINITTGLVYQWTDPSWNQIGALALPQPPVAAVAERIKAPLFVVAEALSKGDVKLSWTPVEGAAGYVVYAMTYKSGAIMTAAVGSTAELTITLPKDVYPVPLSPSTIFGVSTSLTYVVVAYRDGANAGTKLSSQGESSYAVGPLTANSH
jgi:uncharacterized coiled-coil protein SlyX